MDDNQVRRHQPIDVDFRAGETYYWCPCRREAHAESCSCGHSEAYYPPLGFSALVDNTVSVCTCRQTKQPPFCDGSHKLEL